MRPKTKNLFLAITLTILSLALLAPLIIIGYGSVLGGTFNSNQTGAAVGLFFVGCFSTLIASFCWSEV
jgi:hypothetical protein